MNSKPKPLPGNLLPASDREDLYYKMIEEVQDYAILMMDKDGYIVNWNKGAEKIIGYKDHEIISRHFSLFYSQEDQQNKLPEKLLESGAKSGKVQHEGWRVRKNGSTFWGNVSITAIRDSNGQLIGFSKVTRDLTERKIAVDKAHVQTVELAKVNHDLLLAQQQLEKNLMELNRMNKDLEQFAYIASHDLQEPVRKISTYFSMLCQSVEKNFDSKTNALKEKIISSTKRMQKLIDDLLTLSTINEELPLIPVDLTKVLKDVVEDLEMRIADKKAVVEIRELPTVLGVESYLVQLFLNIISNSLKFSDKLPFILISAEIVGTNAVIRIHDNGIGMEEENLHKIFEAFQRLHPKHRYEGTGIGLTICKKIVNALRGKIEVESQVNLGTKFTITLGIP